MFPSLSNLALICHVASSPTHAHHRRLASSGVVVHREVQHMAALLTVNRKKVDSQLAYVSHVAFDT